MSDHSDINREIYRELISSRVVAMTGHQRNSDDDSLVEISSLGMILDKAKFFDDRHAFLILHPRGDAGQPNQSLLDALGQIDSILVDREATESGDTQALIREARAGGMYGVG